ncbi:MAG: hypothetical protein AAGI51_18545 [Pseudomonadota bacterium]
MSIRRPATIQLAAAILPLVVGGVALAGQPPRDDAPMLVVAPPWGDAEAVARAAEARPVGLPSRRAVLVAPEPGLAARLQAAGAWWLADGAALAALCGVRT